VGSGELYGDAVECVLAAVFDDAEGDVAGGEFADIADGYGAGVFAGDECDVRCEWVGADYGGAVYRLPDRWGFGDDGGGLDFVDVPVMRRNGVGSGML